MQESAPRCPLCGDSGVIEISGYETTEADLRDMELHAEACIAYFGVPDDDREADPYEWEDYDDE